MKFKMAEKSLFAVLLRSPWWISVAIALAFVVASQALLPTLYAPFGMVSGLPFLVIAGIAAWRQSQAPDPARMTEALARAGSMPWREFSDTLERAFQSRGYAVTRLNGPAADFHMTKDGDITLVSCKRWKAANHGVDALQGLVTQQQVLAAQHCIYISLAAVSDKARRYATEHGIGLMQSAELAALMMGEA